MEKQMKIKRDRLTYEQKKEIKKAAGLITLSVVAGAAYLYAFNKWFMMLVELAAEEKQ